MNILRNSLSFSKLIKRISIRMRNDSAVEASERGPSAKIFCQAIETVVSADTLDPVVRFLVLSQFLTGQGSKRTDDDDVIEALRKARQELAKLEAQGIHRRLDNLCVYSQRILGRAAEKIGTYHNDEARAAICRKLIAAWGFLRHREKPCCRRCEAALEPFRKMCGE